MAESKVDREWTEGKHGIINRDGEFVTIKTLGEKIQQFKKDVEDAKAGKYVPHKVSMKKTSVEEFLESLDREQSQSHRSIN
jgi:ribosomal protein S6